MLLALFLSALSFQMTASNVSGIACELASMKEDLQCLATLINTQPLAVSVDSREWILLNRKVDHNTTLLTTIANRVGALLQTGGGNHVENDGGDPADVAPLSPLPTPPSIESVPQSIVDSPVTVSLPIKDIPNLRDFHSQLRGSKNVVMQTHLISKCLPDADIHSVRKTTFLVARRTFANSLRAKISYHGTGQKTAEKWSKEELEDKFREALKDIDEDQRIEDLMKGT
jgi:hypothetical protein